MKAAPAVLLLLPALLAAQQPRISNANVQTRAVSSLRADFDTLARAQSAPAWIGYATPKIAGHESMCCSSNMNGQCCGGCSLEGRNAAGQTVAAPTAPIQLEGPTHMLVLYRIDQQKVDRIRVFSPECPLDGGGLAFYWLSGVQPADSVALLESVATRPEQDSRHRDRAGDGAVMAIALHRAPEADAALDRMAAPSQPEWLRRKVTFWLGNARGRHGYDVLTRMLRDDPSDKVREQAIFGLTQSSEPAAVDALVTTARGDKSPHVRGQALFWLAQKASRQAAGAIAEAIERDPETEVKRRAVFALTQLPDGEGVPKLIEVARNNRNPEVRKQAMFWLGQSKDPRALTFFEEILGRK